MDRCELLMTSNRFVLIRDFYDLSELWSEWCSKQRINLASELSRTKDSKKLPKACYQETTPSLSLFSNEQNLFSFQNVTKWVRFFRNIKLWIAYRSGEAYFRSGHKPGCRVVRNFNPHLCALICEVDSSHVCVWRENLPVHKTRLVLESRIIKLVKT